MTNEQHIRAEIFRLIDQRKNATSAQGRHLLDVEIAKLQAKLKGGDKPAPAPVSNDLSGGVESRHASEATKEGSTERQKVTSPETLVRNASGCAGGKHVTTQPDTDANSRSSARPAQSSSSGRWKQPENSHAKEIARRLKAARKAANWRVVDLAEATGVKAASIGSAETSGYGKNARTAVINFLHINPKWIETGEGEMFSQPPPQGSGTGQWRLKDRKSAIETSRTVDFTGGTIGNGDSDLASVIGAVAAAFSSMAEALSALSKLLRNQRNWFQPK